jgi:DNA invertase Pin-like site-specific DNA recombinase
LDDAEIDALLAAVTTEAERRGRLPPSPAKEKPAADAKPLTRQAPTDENTAGSLTTGKLNAVRAAFKAGVKPSAIARQFGISQSDVRKALAAEGQGRKAGR